MKENGEKKMKKRGKIRAKLEEEKETRHRD